MALNDAVEWLTRVWVNFSEWRVSEIVGLLLAIVALVVGIYHLVEIRRATHDVKSVQSALSTRFIGKFPLFLRDIVALIGSAQREIIIFCDYPAYADFSDPPGATDYRYAIEQRRLANVAVELTCMDAAHRAKDANEQFSADRWTNAHNDPVRRESIRRYAEARGISGSAVPTREALLELMEARDQQTLQTVFGGNAVEIPVSMPIYFWIADRRNAVFAIPNVAEGEYEYGFATADLALIQALLRMRERYRMM